MPKHIDPAEFQATGFLQEAKGERAAAQREHHRAARTALFSADTDVEPLAWIHEEDAHA